jgi:hypothetical protein
MVRPIIYNRMQKPRKLLYNLRLMIRARADARASGEPAVLKEN